MQLLELIKMETSKISDKTNFNVFCATSEILTNAPQQCSTAGFLIRNIFFLQVLICVLIKLKVTLSLI